MKGATDVVLFGRRAVLEALAAPRVEIGEVRVARAVPPSFRKELAAACREAGAPLTTTSWEEVRHLSRDARHDQGVAAAARLLNIMEVEALVDSSRGTRARTPMRVLALDGVTNPQNVGMIVRSALAGGMDAMLWPLAGSPWVSGLIVKASAGAIYRCPIARCHTLAEGLYALKRAGFQIVGLAAEAEESLLDLMPPHRTVFVVGSETVGISDEIAELTDQWIRIPMSTDVASLNVAVAASLVCFHRPPSGSA